MRLTKNQRAVLAKVPEYLKEGCWPDFWPRDQRKSKGLERTLWSLHNRGLVEIGWGRRGIWKYRTIKLTEKGVQENASVNLPLPPLSETTEGNIMERRSDSQWQPQPLWAPSPQPPLPEPPRAPVEEEKNSRIVIIPMWEKEPTP